MGAPGARIPPGSNPSRAYGLEPDPYSLERLSDEPSSGHRMSLFEGSERDVGLSKEWIRYAERPGGIARGKRVPRLNPR
jgi:hypothetical protein